MPPTLIFKAYGNVNSPMMMMILSPFLLLQKIINRKLVDWHACRGKKADKLAKMARMRTKKYGRCEKYKESWKLLRSREMMMWAFMWNNKKQREMMMRALMWNRKRKRSLMTIKVALMVYPKYKELLLVSNSIRGKAKLKVFFVVVLICCQFCFV